VINPGSPACSQLDYFTYWAGYFTYWAGYFTHWAGYFTYWAGYFTHWAGYFTHWAGYFTYWAGYFTYWAGYFTYWAGYFTYWAGYFTHWAGYFTYWAGYFTHWAGYFTYWAGYFTYWAGYFTYWAGYFTYWALLVPMFLKQTYKLYFYCPVSIIQPPVQWVLGVLSPGVKRGRGVTLNAHPHLVPRSRMSRSYTSSPPNASMTCSGTAYLTYLFPLQRTSLSPPTSQVIGLFIDTFQLLIWQTR
jgi:hypothetical protein